MRTTPLAALAFAGAMPTLAADSLAPKPPVEQAPEGRVAPAAQPGARTGGARRPRPVGVRPWHPGWASRP